MSYFYIPFSNSLIFGHSIHKVFMQNILHLNICSDIL